MTPELLVPGTLVREILQRVPGAPRAFERHGVDYCCHGDLSVAEASRRVGADGDAVLAALAEEAARPDAEPAWGDDFDRMPLKDVVAHLLDVVHPQSRREVAALRELCPAEGPLAVAVRRLCDELEPHLAFEERYVFPYALAMDETGRIPPALFDTVREPCATLMREHEASDHALAEIRALTDGFRPPDGADARTVSLYAALADHERALIRHMHVEGNALFPRAQQLEEKLRAAAPPRRRRL